MTDISAAQPQASRPQNSGPFRAGDRVQLTGPKGKLNTFMLEPGKVFHSHRGLLAHDAIIGQPDGSIVVNNVGIEHLALRPLLNDFVMAMPRGAAIIYPKDAQAIIGLADIFPGATVVEAGVGSGALSLWLLRAIGPSGTLKSFERREDFATVARDDDVEGVEADQLDDLPGHRFHRHRDECGGDPPLPQLGEELAGPRPPRDAVGDEQFLDTGGEPGDDLVRAEQYAGLLQDGGGHAEPVSDHLQAVLVSPDAPEARDELRFGLHPVRLGVDDGAIHVPENGGRRVCSHGDQV